MVILVVCLVRNSLVIECNLVITDPHTTFRGFYSLSERQYTFKTKPAYTIEGVPVILHLNLRYRIVDPIMLAKNYDDPLQALLNPAQTVINSVVSRLSYQQFMRARKISGDVPDKDHVPWVQEFRSECLRELSEQAGHYGVIVESFDMMDRALEGQLGIDLEKQAEQVLQNQVEATQIELRNHIKAEQERGLLAVQQVKAATIKTQADTDYYAATKVADSKYYATMKDATASAESSALIAQQDAKNIVILAEARMSEIRMQGKAYGEIPIGHAQNIQLSLLEVEKRKAMPLGSIWFEGASNGPSSASLQEGFGFSKGMAIANQRRENREVI